MMERRGPRTERWETPQETVYKDQKLLLHLTRDDKYDLDQLRTEPCMPNQDERWVSKTNTHFASSTTHAKCNESNLCRVGRKTSITQSITGRMSLLEANYTAHITSVPANYCQPSAA